MLDEQGEEIDLKQNFDDDNDIIPQPVSDVDDTAFAGVETIDDDYTSDAIANDSDDYLDPDVDPDGDEITGFSIRDDESPEDLV